MPHSPGRSRTGLKDFTPVFVSFVSTLSTVSIGLLLRQGTFSAVPLTAFAPLNVIATIQCVAGAVSRMGGGIDSRFFALFALAVLMAATNAWSEEMTARLTIVAGLHGKVTPTRINWISAAIFGPPHYFEIPAGPLGVLVAGFMGWLLAKSVQETRGLLWAWFLHFVQDVVIFTGVVIMMLKA